VKSDSGLTVPVVGVAGYKHVGKTTLICGMVQKFSSQGLRVGVLKHDAHGFVATPEGTDTHAFAEAGAMAVAIASPDGHVAGEWRLSTEPSLAELVARVGRVDLVIAEGFKSSEIVKWVLLSEIDRARSGYVMPDFCHDAGRVEKVLGWLVPGPPYQVAEDSRGVYDRNDIETICERTLQTFGFGVG